MEKCTIEGCSKKAKTRGMCPMHYERWRVYKDPHRSVKQGEIHGLGLHPAYMKWKSVRQRLYNPHCERFYCYGKRGIKMSEEFQNPVIFVEYIMSLEGYGEKGLQLDRINNNGDYERGNLRWATRSQQMRNRRPYKDWGKNGNILERRNCLQEGDEGID